MDSRGYESRIKLNTNFLQFQEEITKFSSDDISKFLSSVACIPAHSCYMSALTHDATVTVQSFEDHLGFPLNAFDEIKLEDTIIAWCSESGVSPSIDTSSPINSTVQDLHCSQVRMT